MKDKFDKMFDALKKGKLEPKTEEAAYRITISDAKTGKTLAEFSLPDALYLEGYARYDPFSAETFEDGGGGAPGRGAPDASVSRGDGR